MRVDHPFDYGLVIRTRRTSLKLTQAQLADHVGVSREWLIGLEHGRSSREFRMVIKILEQLGVRVGFSWDVDAVPAWAVPLKTISDAKAIERAARQAKRGKGRASPKAPDDWKAGELSCSRETIARASRDGRRRRNASE